MNNWDPRYDELLYRPHPVSKEHPAMPLRDRAAQFSSFQALNGFEEEIEEEGRWTERAAELDEDRRAVLNERLCRLAANGEQALFTWFVPDGRKAGGSYCRRRAAVKKLDPIERVLILRNGERIPLPLLYDVDCEDASETQG